MSHFAPRVLAPSQLDNRLPPSRDHRRISSLMVLDLKAQDLVDGTQRFLAYR
jgi:hypothetical protein